MNATLPNSFGYSFIPGLAIGFVLNESYHLSPTISFVGGMASIALIMIWLVPRKRRQKIEFLHWFKHWVPDDVMAIDAKRHGYREQLKTRSIANSR